MATKNRQFVRAALSIHRMLSAAMDCSAAPRLPLQTWQRASAAANSVAKARARGWQTAARSKLLELVCHLKELGIRLADLIQELQDFRQPQTLSKPSELYGDLAALQQESFDVQVNLREHQLSVTTEPVVLEGIDLGRFEICLDWRLLKADEPYRVVALDANPAASNSSVTHPHVNGAILCEGDGRASVRRALAEGRLFDFFTMVDRILQTYSVGRAHVELDRWQGKRCEDCSGFIDEEDDYYQCPRCERDVCCDCSSSCSNCDQMFCS